MGYINLSHLPLFWHNTPIHTYARTHACTPRKVLSHHIITFKLFLCLSSPACDELTKEKITKAFTVRLISYTELVLSDWSQKFLTGSGHITCKNIFIGGIIEKIFFLDPALPDLKLYQQLHYHTTSHPITPNCPVLKKQALQPIGETLLPTKWAWVKCLCRVVGRK